MQLKQRIVLKYIRTKFKLLSAFSKKKAARKAFALFCTPQYRNKKKLPPVFEKAEKVHFHFEKSNISGYSWNKDSEKKALILHGFESSVINFDRYITPLTKKGYAVYAFDAPAHGRSTGKMINVVIYKKFIQTIYQNYGPFQAFIAHSLGGLALSLALEDIAPNATDKVVFIAPATETTTAIETYFKFLKLDAGVRTEFDKLVEQLSGRPPVWFSISRAAKNIKAQVFWAHDKEDNMTPLKDVQPVIEAHYPNISFMITEGLGHRRIYRDNKVSKAIIDFL